MSELRQKYIFVGAVVLAFLAATLNVHFILSFGVSVSHVTGDISRLAQVFVDSNLKYSKEIIQAFLSIIGFLSGAILSGFLLHGRTFAFKRPYGKAIIVMGLVMFVVCFLEGRHTYTAVFLAALVCGAQNAMSTFYRGLIVRTTHLTGILTDVGQMIGMRISGAKIEKWKVYCQVSVLLVFFAGVYCGALLHLKFPKQETFLIASAYLLVGITWYLGKKFFLRNLKA